ncbi:MAG TPA: GNAT family N-acetyltransferase [Candidatus Aquilonibacter sp.]|nr:GNAT family N-acetyltransferase [Candidatus Aquilonibacter sp.]
MTSRRSSCIPLVRNRVYANLSVTLDERYGVDRTAREYRALEAMGFSVQIHHGAPDRVLAWIDDAFGGAWSSEAHAGANVVAMHGDAIAGFATIDPRGLRYAWLRGAAADEGSGVFGPFGVAEAFRGEELGAALLAIALCELRARGYVRAIIAAVGAEKLVAYYARHAHASIVETFDPLQFVGRKPRAVILASGSGTNAQAVIDDVAAGLPLDLRAVVSNKRDAFVLERGSRAGIDAITVAWNRKEEPRASYDVRLLDAVASFEPELVLLLGWMHLLDPAFVTAFPELLNIHPAFLPLDSSRDIVAMPDGEEVAAFRGAHAVRDALEAKSRWVGATMHGVTVETDRGPVFARRPLSINEQEDERQVLERLHPLEHQVVRTAVRRWLYER